MNIHKNISRAAGAISFMTFLSRIFGFIRDMIIAMTFGSSAAADAFFVAFRIPNVQRRVFGEGAITAAFIPVYTEELNDRSPQSAWDFTSQLFSLLFYVLVFISLIIILFAPYLITIIAPGFLEQPIKFDLTVKLTRWMAPFLILIGLAALCMGILNACNKFALPAAAPIMLNISMIGSILLISPHMEHPIFGLAIGVLIGGSLQLLIQLPIVIQKGLYINFHFIWRHPGIKKFKNLMIPAIFGLAVYEVNILVDTILASFLSDGSISFLYYGNRLVQLPLGVFGVAISIAILPLLSNLAIKNQMAELKNTLAFSIRMILFITIPAAIGLMILAFPIINTLWERGEFLRETTNGTAVALLYYSIGLPAFAGIKVIVNAYYSMQDTKTPMKIGIYAMLLNIILNIILMGPLQHGGLALATSLSAIINCLLLIHFIRKKIGGIEGHKIYRSTLKLLSASIPMGIIVFFLKIYFYDDQASLGYRSLVLIGCISFGIISYLLISFLNKSEELIFLKNLNNKNT